MDRKTELLNLYELLPFDQHPLWVSIKAGHLTYDQVIRAEVQHWIRTRAGRTLREQAVTMARAVSPAIFEQLLETYLEECTDDDSGPSHLELIERLVLAGGYCREQLESAEPTPANSAAMALYAEISRRGAGCHMLGAGAVEYYYCQLSPKIFDAYTRIYKMSAVQAETYKIHGPMDKTHAERAFAVLDEAVAIHGWESVRRSVRRCVCRDKLALRRDVTRGSRNTELLGWEVNVNGYIYTMFAGADPGHGWVMNDPIFGKTPTLGACVPHIRRVVELGDYIFVISGRVPGERQFVVGGFEVREKIHALAAFKKYPENRLRVDQDGQLTGNIIINSKGEHHPLDDHENFERRVENYIVGGNPVVSRDAAPI